MKETERVSNPTFSREQINYLRSVFGNNPEVIPGMPMDAVFYKAGIEKVLTHIEQHEGYADLGRLRNAPRRG